MYICNTQITCDWCKVLRSDLNKFAKTNHYPFVVVTAIWEVKELFRLRAKSKFRRVISDNYNYDEHCYMGYIRSIYKEIRDNLDYKEEKYYKNYQYAIMYFLCKHFDEPESTDNELYKLVLKKTNKLGKKKISMGQQISDETDKLLSKFLDKTYREQFVKERVGQNLFREKLLSRSQKCRLCGLSKIDLLKSSHIKRWCDSSDFERLDYHNGFLFCPQHDALFDKGYMSFDNEGLIMISSLIKPIEYPLLNINENMKIQVLEKHKNYLEYHRENIYKK